MQSTSAALQTTKKPCCSKDGMADQLATRIAYNPDYSTLHCLCFSDKVGATTRHRFHVGQASTTITGKHFVGLQSKQPSPTLLGLRSAF